MLGLRCLMWCSVALVLIGATTWSSVTLVAAEEAPEIVPADDVHESFLVEALARGEAAFVIDYLKTHEVPPALLNYRRPADGQTLLHLAVLEKNFDLAEAIALEPGVDLNVFDAQSRTPLHWAIITGEDAIAMGLVKVGADCKMASDQGSAYLLSKIHDRPVVTRMIRGLIRHHDAPAAPAAQAIRLEPGKKIQIGGGPPHP
jgi:hypothetical protein